MQDKAPFSNPPRGAEGRRSHWVKPELVAEVTFTEWTDEGTLRHPSFQGLREDKQASDVVRERPVADVRVGHPALNDTKATRKRPGAVRVRDEKAKQPAAASSANNKDIIAGITLTNPTKLLYPDTGINKRDLALYYEAVADWMIPHLRQRPLTLLRCPNGWQKECFYQKKAGESVHDAIDRVEVRTSHGAATYMMANSVSAVVALLQMGVLEIHPWGATAGKLGFPDRMAFDFDPDDGSPWKDVVQAVKLIRTLLEDIGLQGFLKTTGGKGLHVVVPIAPTQQWDAIKGFTKAIAELFAATFPDRFTANISKAARRGRIFVDYLRNDEGSTAIAAYSLRARANAPVAIPVAWDELSRDIRFDHFNVTTVPARLKRLRNDPWQEFFEIRQSITDTMMRKVGYIR